MATPPPPPSRSQSLSGIPPEAYQDLPPLPPMPKQRSGGMGMLGYGIIAVLLIIIAAFIAYVMMQPGKKCPSCEKCPSRPTCPECEVCDECPETPACPECPKRRRVVWRRYPSTNAVWGLGGFPKHDPSLEFSGNPPAGVKLYGRFDNPDDCEAACKADQPFCASWAQSPKMEGNIWSRTCYGIDNTHFRAHHSPDGSVAGRRTYVE